MNKSLPYRRSAGVALINRAGEAFIGRRARSREASLVAGHEWQMPQGGIDDGEEPYAAALRELLAAALGVAGRVLKRRLVYRLGRTRIHLDDVRDLGPFLELEVELASGEPADVGVREAKRLMGALEIGEEALIAGAYVDLLDRRST